MNDTVFKHLKTVLTCPDCKKYFKSVSGLTVRCKCGYVEDSTYTQIVNFEDFKEELKIRKVVNDER